MSRILTLALAAIPVLAQTPTAVIERAATLAEHGRCAEAVPLLKKSTARLDNADLKRRVGLAGVRCAMSLNQSADATYFLTWLNHEFPRDPAILYLSTHVYSDLATRASQELLFTAPASPEVHELNAEALEMQGKWQDALAEYRAVLEKDPRMAGIHYRIGRLLLSQPETPAGKEEARKEFEAELKIDPNNAGAEFVLGELSRQSESWPAAIEHFSRAAQLDAGFFDAYLGWGRALLGANQDAAAVPPLEHAAKLEPDNPQAHFQLATAYRRVGRKPDGDREFALYKQATIKAGDLKDNVAKGILGNTPKAP